MFPAVMRIGHTFSMWSLIIAMLPPSGVKLLRVHTLAHRLKPNLACHGARWVEFPERLSLTLSYASRISEGSLRSVTS
jgi:hypothetical protein